MLGKVLIVANAVIICGLVLLLVLAVWDFTTDVGGLRHVLLLEEMNRLRSQAAETVQGIEEGLDPGSEMDPNSLATNPSLAVLRERLGDARERWPYAAIVNLQGMVVWHSDRRQQGKDLGRQWYEHSVSRLGGDVVQTRKQALTTGVAAYDLRTPILVGGRDFGRYHIGLSQTWFDELAAAARSRQLLGSAVSLGAILILLGASLVSLDAGRRRTGALQQAITDTYMQAASELGRLAAGLAHEIRNPLYAVRLNLHAFQRTQQDPKALEAAEITRMLDQSSVEIDRIDQLLRQLIDFAVSDHSQVKDFNLNSELEGVVDFVRQELRDSKANVQLALPRNPVSIRMDPGRLRQIVLNLLHAARDAMPDGGDIDVQLVPHEDQVEITVADQGSGIAEADRPHVFEPFFSSGSNGAGLSLALVRRFVQEAGGEIHCEANQPHGTRFRIRLDATARGPYHRSA